MKNGRADYSAEVGARWPLPVATRSSWQATLTQGAARGISPGRASDTGAFETFVFPDGMVSQALVRQLRR